MPKIGVGPGLAVNCEVDDFLWPWTDSTPVLLQHGFSRNAGIWCRWVPELSKTRRVYRPDMRGCGKSDTPPAPLKLEPQTLVADMLRVMDELDLERVHWVGDASGGVLGLVFAAMHPERVASLILINVPVQVHPEKGPFAFGEASIGDAIRKFGIVGWGERTLPSRIDTEHSSPQLQSFIMSEMGKTQDHVAAAIHDCVETIDTFPLLGELKVPVLILVGDRPPNAVQDRLTMEREIPNVRSKVFDGYGNSIHMVAPELCVPEVVSFLESIDPSS